MRHIIEVLGMKIVDIDIELGRITLQMEEGWDRDLLQKLLPGVASPADKEVEKTSPPVPVVRKKRKLKKASVPPQSPSDPGMTQQAFTDSLSSLAVQYSLKALKDAADHTALDLTASENWTAVERLKNHGRLLDGLKSFKIVTATDTDDAA